MIFCFKYGPWKKKRSVVKCGSLSGEFRFVLQGILMGRAAQPVKVLHFFGTGYFAAMV